MNFTYSKTTKGQTLFNKLHIDEVTEYPGVYIYFGDTKKPLYIGKAKNLKRRIRSYQTSSLLGKTKKLISETKYFTVIEVNSELESLLLEAYLVRKHKPLYNSQLKDDKNPLYIKITKDKYPKVLTVRKRDVGNNKSTYFGPFPKSEAVKTVLAQLRKIFPYSQHNVGKRACIYSQIGLCSPCPNEIEQIADPNLNNITKRLYLKNINYIKSTLSGRINSVSQRMEKELLSLSKNEEYEKANILKEKIEKFDYITQPITPINDYLTNPNMAEDIRSNEIRDLKRLIKKDITFQQKLSRIECYDIAHIQGSFPTASMVTFIEGVPDKNLYRHFRIRQKSGANDIASLHEVAKRRVKHLSTWGKPDLVIVDGGKSQTKIINEIFSAYGIPVIGIAKRSNSLIIPNNTGGQEEYIQFKIKPSPGLRLIQRLRDESHRFARRYHHNLLQKHLIPDNIR